MLFIEKKIFFILNMAHADPFLSQVGPKNSNFWRFYQKKFQNYWIAIKVININLIPNLFHWKSANNKVGVVLGTKFGSN